MPPVSILVLFTSGCDLFSQSCLHKSARSATPPYPRLNEHPAHRSPGSVARHMPVPFRFGETSTSPSEDCISPMPHWMGPIVHIFKIPRVIFDLINETSHMSLVTSTPETIIFRTKRVVWENILTAGEKKKSRFHRVCKQGNICGFVSYVLLFLAKAKGSFLCNESGPFVFANASHPFLPSKKLFSQEKTAQAEIKGKPYL
ncbi:uncharacterized protein LOC119799575 [Arvicola amphibius]|uniref:uncharacterized protein LOC119799575 n=1 Tax=Arvicola amphibius TaxID=1047088 RepID=UPI001C087381|nr:uncharacterized protein LOC119799575 [Arvicola amphibius]